MEFISDESSNSNSQIELSRGIHVSSLDARNILEKSIRRSSDNNAIFSPPTTMPIILGSSSVFRQSVLRRHGWSFSVQSPDIDEKSIRSDDPFQLPLKIAIAKSHAIIARFESDVPTIIITCDQISLYDGTVREKPQSIQEAHLYLSSYSNSSVSTVSAVVVTILPSQKQSFGIDIAKVRWKEIPEDAIQRIIKRGVILSCAGVLSNTMSIIILKLSFTLIWFHHILS